MGISLAISLSYLVQDSPFTWRSTFPHLEGAEEGLGIFVTQQVGGLIQFHRAMLEVMLCQLAPRIFHHLLKRDARIRKPTL